MTEILIAGAGPMAVEYAKVLKAQSHSCIIIGRGEESAAKCEAETGINVFRGGLESWLSSNKTPSHAIVAVGEKWVGKSAIALMQAGCKNLLVEKPGGFDAADIKAVKQTADKTGADVKIGYNRRFYAATDAAKRIIAEDGGVTSFCFEFTEWGHVIAPLVKEDGVKEQWFLSNSTHVIDLAYHLGGKPDKLSAYTAGGTSWHPIASIFAGAGRSNKGALFSYQANWEAPGRWWVEMLTRKHRLIFKPMETLQIQKIGSVAIEPVEINNELDKNFKPGLYKQIASWLGDGANLPTIAEQVEMLDIYLKMRGDA